MVFYFTGTGNSLYIAKRIEKQTALKERRPSVSKNWLADSRLHKCGVIRRIGKPLDRVSHDATAHRAVASPFLILMKAKDFASGGTRPKALPLESAAFWKRPAKTFCALFFAKRLF